MKLKTLFAIPLLAASSHAAILLDWNLDQVNYPGHPAAAVNNASFTGVPNTTATVGDHLSVSDLTTASSAGHAGLVWSTGNAGPGKLNLQRWDHPSDNPGSTGNGNGTPNNWLQFTLTAEANHTITLESIDLTAWRNGGGAPANWRFDYFDTDASDWVAFASAHAEGTTGTAVSTSFTGSVTSDEFLLRFVAYGPTGGTGNIHITEMVLNGSVSAIPEPATALLGAFGVLALLRRRR